MAKWVWGDEQKESFASIKTAIEAVQPLTFMDPSKPFTVATDASDFHMGAVLLQRHEGELKPIEWASQTLKKAEINYPISEKELLAVVWALAKWRVFLLRREFTLLTDHKMIENLFRSVKDELQKSL